MTTRPTWHQVWEHVSEVTGARSLCSRAQVGAVIVDKENRVVATGYNGPPAGFDHQDKPCTEWCPRAKEGNSSPEPGYTDCPALHAEANALMASDRTRRIGGTIYVCSVPCYTCAKLIANSGLSAVFVSRESTDRGYRNPNKSYDLLHDCGIEVISDESR